MYYMINKERLIKTFLQIVQIDSPSGYEEKILEEIKKIITDIGYSFIQDDFGNLIVKVDGEGKALLLTAHLDTVEPGRSVKPVIQDGVISSSGNTILGADNKVAVAVLLELLQILKEQNLKTRPLEFVFTLSEEVANLGAVNLDYSLLDAKTGYSFDAGLPIGTVISASPYYNRFDIEIIGKTSHASRPENGLNVLSVLNNALNNIQLGRLECGTLCNIGVIESGHVRNSVPGNMIVQGEVRSFFEDKLEKVNNNIISAFEKSGSSFGVKIKAEVVRENGGFVFDKNNSLINTVRSVMNNLNIDMKLEEAGGCYDANIFHEHGIKVLNIADGTKDTHSVEERIAVEDFVSLANIAFGLIKRN
jgi:tripeptide aminopeptidase